MLSDSNSNGFISPVSRAGAQLLSWSTKLVMANWICPGRRACWFGSLVRSSPLCLPFLPQPLLCSLGTARWLLTDAVSAFRTEVPQIFGSFPDWSCVFWHRRQRAPNGLCVHREHCLCKSKSGSGKGGLSSQFFYCFQLKIHWFKISCSQHGFLFSCLEDLSLWRTLAHPEHVTQIARLAQQGWQCASDCVFPLFL